MREKIAAARRRAFECAEDDLVLEDGKVSIAGVPGKFVKLGELASQANPMRGAVEPGTEPGLESTQVFRAADGRDRERRPRHDRRDRPGDLRDRRS